MQHAELVPWPGPVCWAEFLAPPWLADDKNDNLAM